MVGSTLRMYIMNFTNEEIILEMEIKRKDTLAMKYIEPIETKIRETVNLLGSNMIVLTNQDDSDK